MIQKLWLKQYRNLDEILFDCSEKRSIFIYGDNNQGKTNFLESIYFLSKGKSPNEQNQRYLVRLGSSEAILAGEFYNTNTSEPVRIYSKLKDDGKRYFVINKTEIKRVSLLSKALNAEYISADIIKIFKESPEYRRKDLDRFLCSYFSEYAYILKFYEKIIKQKNKILKEQKGVADLRIWNSKLIEYSEKIFLFRIKGLLLITNLFQSLLANLSTLQNVVGDICYKIKGNTTDYITDVKAYSCFLQEQLNINQEKEYQAGFCLYGPHRDDLTFYLDTKDLFSFYSRGINRCCAILYKLSQIKLIHQKNGLYPIILLDDAFAELDKDNKVSLMQLIESMTQVFYTSVQKEDAYIFSYSPMVVKMQNGKLING